MVQSDKFNFIHLNDGNKHPTEMSNLDFESSCYCSHPMYQE